MIRIDPIYPVGARIARIEGWTCLVFTVAAEGHVRDAKVSVSAPEGYFEDAALKAVRQWRYQPGAADTPGNVVLLNSRSLRPLLQRCIGAFTINAANLEPIVTKNCDPVAPDDVESVLNSTVAEFASEFGMSCKQQADDLSYLCLDQEQRTIGRMRIWNSFADCRQYPSKFADDAKTLMNRR